MTCTDLPRAPMAVGDEADWSRDWEPLIGNEVILQSTWHPVDGLTFGASSVNGQVTTQWVTADKRGTFALTNEIVTDAGRRWFRTVAVVVVPKL